MRWDGHVARIEDGRGVYRVLVGKCQRRARRKWEDKIDLQEVGLMGMDWIDLAQDRDRWLALVNVVMNIQLP